LSNYSGYNATGIVLGNFASQNPVTIQSNGTIEPSGAFAAGIYSAGVYAWTIDNFGTIATPGSGAAAIYLKFGGVIANQPGGHITSNPTSGDGVLLIGGGTVTNQQGATISAYLGVFANIVAATLTNFGVIAGNPSAGVGIVLQAGGSVTNQTTGTLTGVDGVFAAVTTASLTNYGSIQGAYDGAFLLEGGTVLNQPGGTIGGADYGVKVRGTNVSTVTNFGTIDGIQKAGIGIATGGVVSNAGTGVVTGGHYGVDIYDSAATVINAATITVAGVAGVVLFAGGTVSNIASGLIQGGNYGVAAVNTAATVMNQGRISGTANSGVFLGAGGYVSNAAGGTIAGDFFGVQILGTVGSVVNLGSIVSTAIATETTTFNAVGVALLDGGTINNATSASIGATLRGVQIGEVGAPANGTVLNQGVIYAANGNASTGEAVWIYGTGLISNASTGTIGGGPFGIVTYMQQDTVLNAGLIHSPDNDGALLVYGGSVTNQHGGTISGYYFGVRMTGTTGSVINDGSVLSTATYNSSGSFDAAGVAVLAGGTVINDGTIKATWKGVEIGRVGASFGGTLLNQGLIYASGVTPIGDTGAAAWIHGPGLISNASNGTITGGPYGIVAYYQTTVLNAGTIGGTQGLHATGVVTVVNDGVMSFADMVAGGTFTNAGTAAGLYLGGSGSNRLVVEAGAVLGGVATGGNGAINTLEFTSSSVVGTLSGLGTAYVGFSQITIDSGAQWVMQGSNAITAGETLNNAGVLTAPAGKLTDTGLVLNNGLLAADPGLVDLAGSVGGAGVMSIGSATTLELDQAVGGGQTISFADATGTLVLGDVGGFQGTIGTFFQGDEIFVSGQTVAADSFIGNELTLYAAGGGTIGILPFASGAATSGELFANAQGGVGGAAPCFAAGTRIATHDGEVAVEALRAGDRVLTVLGGTPAPIIWIGQRHVDCTRHPNPAQVWPVRVQAGAFGHALPHRDLLLSPDHAVYVNGVLIPVKYLINDTTIAQVQSAAVTYWHLELPRHDVVLAEGLPAESFLDMKDGSNYANRPGPVRLFADFTVRMWEAEGCAPLIVAGPELVAARALVARYAALPRAA